MKDKVSQTELEKKLQAAEKRIAELEKELQSAKEKIAAVAAEDNSHGQALRLSLALEAAQVGIWEWDLRTNKDRWSNELWAVYGLEPHSCEPSYEAWRNIIHPEDREQAEQAAQKAAQTGTELSSEWRILADDGSVRWVMSRGRPIKNASDQIERFLGVVFDITERKQAEESFQASEMRYRSLFKNMLNGFAYCRMLFDQGKPQDFIYLEVNRAFETLTGLKNVVGKKVSELIPGIQESDPELIKVYGRVAITGIPETFEIYMEALQMWFSVSAYSPQPEHFVTIFDVITSRKQVEKALRASQENFERAFESNPAALAITRLTDGTVIKINTAYTRLTGYELAEILGSSGSEMNMFVDHNVRQEYVRLLQDEGRVRDHEVRVRIKSGDIKNTVVYMEPFNFGGENCILTALLDITDRKQAEKKLRASEAKFKAVFNNAPIGISLLDVERRLLQSNEMLEQIVRINKAGLVAGAYRNRKYIREDNTEIPVSELASTRAIVENRTVRNVVNGIILEDGEVIWTQVSAAPLDLPEKQIVVITQDITERKRAEEQLRESELRFSTIFHNSPVGKHIFRLTDGRSMETNDAFLQLIGYTRGEVAGRTAAELNLFVDPAARQNWMKALHAGQRVQNQDADIRCKNGEIRHTLASLNVIDINNEPMVLVIATDITDRKRAEDALWESEQRLKAAIKPSNMIFGQTDLEARYTWVHNPHPDFDPEAILGKTDIELADNEGARALFESKRQVITSGNGIKTEISFPVSDGPNIYDVFIDPLYNADGQLVGVTTSSYDITHQKRIENELRRSNAELEQFAYVASHDLQEPLRAVAGMVQLLSQRYKGRLDNRADEYINHAVEASTRMQNLINDLLDYSRVDRFGKPFEQTDVEESLQLTLANLQITIQDSQAQITHDPLPTVMADPLQLIHVLQNLVGNAIKFRGDAPPQVHISATKKAEAWRFSVSDNGIGIEPQYFERIFLVFQRLHTRREYPGTGIGLSLCKKIIERHGGRIWVESQPGQGTTFYFTIPERTP